MTGIDGGESRIQSAPLWVTIYVWWEVEVGPPQPAISCDIKDHNGRNVKTTTLEFHLTMPGSHTHTHIYSLVAPVLVSSGWHIKYNSLDSLNNRNLFLTVLKAGNPRSRCWQGRCHLLWAHSWVSSCYVIRWLPCVLRERRGRERERERIMLDGRVALVSVTRAPIPSWRLHPTDLLTLITSQRHPLQLPSHWGKALHTWILNTTIQPIMAPNP